MGFLIQVSGVLYENFERRSLSRTNFSFDPHVFSATFLGLLLIFLAVYLIGVAFCADGTVFWETWPIALVCLALLLSFFSISFLACNVVIGILLTYLLTAGVVFLSPPLFGAGIFILALLGFALCAVRLRVAISQLVVTGIACLSVALFILACANHPFNISARLHTGDYHMDLAFHASIAAMLKNYGVVSTGLHGLVETPYHVFSHALMAGISILSGAPVILVYGVAHWALFVPVLFFALVYFAVILGDLGSAAVAKVWVWVCLVLVALAQLIAPLSMRFATSEDSASIFSVGSLHAGLFFLGSESYVLSLGLFSLGACYLLKANLGPRDVPIIALLAAALACAKASTGLFFVGLLTSRALFNWRRETVWTWLSAVSSVVLVTAAVFPAASATASEGEFGLELFSHIRRYGHFGEQMAQVSGLAVGFHTQGVRSILYTMAALFLFFLQQFLVPFLVFWIVNRNPSQWSFLQRIYVAGGCAIAVLLVSLFRFSEGNAFWFFNLASFVSLPFLIVIIALTLESGLRGSYFPGWKGASSLVSQIAVALVIPTWLLSQNFFRDWRVESAATQPSMAIEALAAIRENAPTDVALRMRPGWLDRIPHSQCLARPFVLSAVSERPWVNVLSRRDQCRYRHYGYGVYGMVGAPHLPSPAPVLLPGMIIVDPDNLRAISSGYGLRSGVKFL